MPVNSIVELIASGSPWQYKRLPEVYMDGGFVPHDQIVSIYLDMDNRSAVKPIRTRIKSLLDAGATVNFFGQESRYPEIFSLKNEIARHLNAEVETSFFLSQKNHPGLAPHYDCVEIFVVQLFGEKQWKVSSQRVDAPLVGYGDTIVYDPSVPHADIVMCEGDVLYIPRGTFHHACAVSDTSLHLAIAIKVPQYIDFFHDIISSAAGLDETRSYLPYPFDADILKHESSIIELIKKTLRTREYESAIHSKFSIRTGHQLLPSKLRNLGDKK